jgi:hypothetical protein
MKGRKMKKLVKNVKNRVFVALGNDQGMELVQVAIIIGIAIVVGLVFKKQISDFVTNTFAALTNGKFYG